MAKFYGPGQSRVIILLGLLEILLVSLPLFGQEQPLPLKGHHFSTGLILSPALPLGETSHIFNPGAMPLADFTFNLNLNRVNLGFTLASGALLARTLETYDPFYTLLAFPLALQLKLSTRPDAFSKRHPFQLFVEGGGGVIFHINSDSLPQTHATESALFYPLVLWDYGLSYFVAPRLSVAFCFTGVFIPVQDFHYFNFNPALRVDFFF